MDWTKELHSVSGQKASIIGVNGWCAAGPRGPMDTASDFESEDCGFESHRGRWHSFCFKVARNEVENASFAQRSAHRDSRIWRPELIEPAAERKRRARGRRPTFKSAFPDPRILPQCNISSNYPL